MEKDQQEKIIKSHRYFSSYCFNQAWEIIDKSEKTKEDVETMLHLSHASFWHWSQVPDHTPTNLSVGYWQLSRVYALAGKGEEALFYGNRCIQIGLDNHLPPFYIGYGYEGVARAYRVLQNIENAEKNKTIALEYAEQVEEAEEKKYLQDDIRSL